MSSKHQAMQNNVGILRLDGTGSVERLVWTESAEWGPTLSRDGRWLAYSSNESGQHEVYVQEFPSMGRRFQVSSGGGQVPRWHRNGKELFYWNAGGIVAVEVETDPEWAASLPRVLFEGSYGNLYDVFPRGDRFAMIESTSGDNELVVVENWFEELERLVPAE